MTPLAIGQVWHTARETAAESPEMHECARAVISEIGEGSVTFRYVDVTVMGTFHGGNTLTESNFRSIFPSAGDLPPSAWPKLAPTLDLSAVAGITYQSKESS